MLFRLFARRACTSLMLGMSLAGPLEFLSAQVVRPTQRPAQPQSSVLGAGADSTRSGSGYNPWQGNGPLLDRPISRTEYVLGPGDVLTLAILGYSNQVVPVAVTPEGTVVVPNVGVVRVGGLNIEQAERLIARTTRRFYEDADVSVSLASVRAFKIFVVGAVDEPGVRNATAVTRVSEVVPPVNDNGVARRNVQVRRVGGDTLHVDLVPFLQTGDLTQNPTLRDGDVIQVPRVDETVVVNGALTYAGAYEFRQGETLADLLRMANGGGEFPSNAADTVWLMRFTTDPQGEIQSMPRQDAAGAVGRGILLQAGDAVFVPRRSHFRQHRTARVGGEVQRPGVYPIRPGETTVRDLIEMAGGFTPEASLVDAVLRRQPVVQPRDSLRLLENVPPELLTRDEQRVLQVTSRASDRNVVIDFMQLFADGGSAYDIPLQDGDELFVPERRDEVVVLGAVVQPGILNYQAGLPIEHFIQMAGGYSRRADKNDMVVIKAKLGSRLHPDDVTFIEPGDRIIVPFKEPMTFLERVQTTQGVVSTISGLILTIVGLERLW